MLYKVLLLSLFITPFMGFSQACDCPDVGTCSPCQGGLTSLTLKYNGILPGLIQAVDNSGTFYTSFHNPGDVFVLNGTHWSTGIFQGTNVTMTISGLYNTTINANCATQIYVGDTEGAFEVIAGSSKDGGMLCCAPGDTESVPPVITNCPSDINSTLVGSSCTKAVTWMLPTAIDNCTLVSFTSDHSSGDQFSVGTTLVTYTATDSYGNEAFCSFNVIVNDGSSPVISNCPTDIIVNATASCDATVAWTAPTAIDNCTLASFTSNHTSGEQFPIGSTAVTYTATDGDGNNSICTFNVIVNDATPPVISNCPTDIIVNATASCDATVTWTAPTAIDNCTLASFTSNHTSGEQFPIGSTAVTYTATDGDGNVSICTFNVIVNDATPPVISNCPTDITVIAGAGCDATVTWTAPTAIDNCTLASFTSNHTSGEQFPIGSTAVTYTATDGDGNNSICTFNVIVNDATPPVISNCPTDITINATTSCNATATWTAPTAIDNCTLASFTSNRTSGEQFAIGSTAVTYTATDGDGNTSICSFNVIVNDATPPFISNCPSDIVIDASENCDAVVSWTAPTATDNCAMASFTNSHVPGSTFPIGETQVTYTATDASGNVSVCEFKVTVTNQQLPVITNCPSDITVDSNINEGTGTVIWDEPLASVVCGNISLTSTHQPNSDFPVGTTRVVYTAESEDGSITTCSFNVTVNFISTAVKVGKVITPDGDGFNDVWSIEGIEEFADNHVIVIDRWGSLIYETSGYDNTNVVWDGANKSGAQVPTGTYFYTLEIRAFGTMDKRKGFIELIR